MKTQCNQRYIHAKFKRYHKLAIGGHILKMAYYINLSLKRKQYTFPLISETKQGCLVTLQLFNIIFQVLIQLDKREKLEVYLFLNRRANIHYLHVR